MVKDVVIHMTAQEKLGASLNAWKRFPLRNVHWCTMSKQSDPVSAVEARREVCKGALRATRRIPGNTTRCQLLRHVAKHVQLHLGKQSDTWQYSMVGTTARCQAVSSRR